MHNKKNLIIMISLVALLVAAFLFFTLMNRQPPLIEELSLFLSEPGDRLEVRGRHFGEDRALSEVYFDDRQLNLSYVEEWSDTAISIVVPPFSDSALVRVETVHGVSNPIVLYNQDDFPHLSLVPFPPEYPYIEFIDPSEGGSGTLVTVRGSNFGHSRRDSRIIINGTRDNDLAYFDEPDERDFIELHDENYLSWGMNSLSFYVPDGVESGFLYLITHKGYSNPIYFDVTERGSETSLSGKTTYQILQNLSVDQVGAWEGNSLFFWMPLPSESYRQRGLSLISESQEPYIEHGETTLYRLDNLVSGEPVTVNRQFVVTLYNSKIVCDSSNIPVLYDSDRPLFALYTRSEEYYPTTNRSLRGMATRAAGGYRNPYSKAYSIYSYLINQLHYSDEATEGSPLTVLNEGQGNTRDYTRTLVTLLRAVGIPSREVTGVLLSESGDSSPHHWVEIYFERVGWFPVDPSLGDGLDRGLSMDQSHYWGGLTNRHLAFSKGITETETLDDRGITVEGNSPYSWQAIDEEKKGNLSFYRSHWKLPYVVNHFSWENE